MFKTVEAVVEEDGRLRSLEPVDLPRARRVRLMILDGESRSGASETALLSEAALAEDWLRDEEEEAWRHLQEEA